MTRDRNIWMGYNLSPEKKALAISLLCEGSSIRATERITGVHRDTIMRLGVRVGDECRKILDQKMMDLDCKNVEVDEIWGFIGKKRKNATPEEEAEGLGDVWTFIAMDADTKLIPCFVAGKRSLYHARAFIEDLASRMKNRIQLSSDGLPAYVEAVERGFGSEVDYGQVVKTFSTKAPKDESLRKYSPEAMVGITKSEVVGKPKRSRICTSHIEKQNHTLRMHCRRLTRLTNGFSKKFDNFQAAVGMNFAYYNFVKTNSSIRMTPAQAAGVENSAWTVPELLERCHEI